MIDHKQCTLTQPYGKTIHITLPSFPQFVSLARLTVASVGNMIGFSVEDIEDLKVAVSEACTNALCHGQCEDACYDLYYTVEPERIIIQVKDNGDGYKPEDVEEPVCPGEKAGGFGLFIIKTLMDEVSVETQKGIGTSITMIKRMRG